MSDEYKDLDFDDLSSESQELRRDLIEECAGHYTNLGNANNDIKFLLDYIAYLELGNDC